MDEARRASRVHPPSSLWTPDPGLRQDQGNCPNRTDPSSAQPLRQPPRLVVVSLKRRSRDGPLGWRDFAVRFAAVLRHLATPATTELTDVTFRAQDFSWPSTKEVSRGTSHQPRSKDPGCIRTTRVSG